MHTRVFGWGKDDYLTRLVFRSLVIGDFNAIYEYSRIVCLRSCATAGDFEGDLYLPTLMIDRCGLRLHKGLFESCGRLA